MDLDPDEIVTVELSWDNDTGPTTYSRDLTRRQLGNLLVQVDDMAADTDARAWPTPGEAYALAPGIVSEMGWTAVQAANQPFGTRPAREFWLRKAALLDRLALQDVADDAAEAAQEAAERLMSLDDSGVICDPRHYVRQQYAHWITHQ
uniref:Uncharacterized protein n=1 Tax=Streptomyces sp. NBC_00180 TaxID=2903632 RepID=A0AAU1HWF4_9ACTN